MTTAQNVLDVARGELGYHEGANNNTKYGAWYGLNNAPWCDMFVSWVFAQVGAADIGGKFAYCPSHVNWFRSRGQWFTSNPQPGDVIFYDWNKDGVADHVGLVESVLDGTYPAAIEGNSGDANTSEGVAVARHSRSLSVILGYGRPSYSTSAYRPPINTTDPKHQEDDMFTTDDANRLKNIEKALQFPGGGGASWSQALANQLAEIKQLLGQVQLQGYVPGQPYLWDDALNNKLDAIIEHLGA